MQAMPTLFLMGLLAVGALVDVSVHRVPNALVVIIALAGVSLAVTAHGLPQTAISLGYVVAVATILALPWQRGMLGGGDVKLIAASAVWFRPDQLPLFLATTAIAGGLLSLIAYAAAFARRPIAAEATQSTVGRARSLLHNKVPYGVAIAAGGMFTALAGR